MKSSILSCLLLLTFHLFGQINISGTVQDQQGNGLPYTNIIAFHESDSSFYKGFLAEEDGHFEITLKTGLYRLEFSYIGMDKKVIAVKESTQLGKLQLSPLATTLEAVSIKASRPMLERKQDRLIVNVENSILSAGNNTLEVLQKSPGIIVDQDGNISMNGRNGVRVYLDGKDSRLNGSQLSSILEGMPANSIEKIEIITNPSAKYEAQGNAGIIDIITKKGKLLGTNGSISISPGLGHYFRWENTININHRTEKFNLYGHYSFAKRNQYMEILIDRKFFEQEEVSAQVDMHSLFRLPIETHSPRVGVDYTINDKAKVGVLFTGFANLTGQDAFNDILSTDGDEHFILAQTTETNTSTNWYQYSSNINFLYNISKKSDLEFDFDFARYNNESNQNFASRFFDQNQNFLFSNVLLGNVDGHLNLIGLNADYSIAIKEKQKLELGLKSTWVTQTII